MKGIVFTEFTELVEEKFGLEMVDIIIEESELPSQGIYTAVGTYDYTEMLTLVTCLSKHCGVPVPDLVHAFGRHLFGAFIRGYPYLFEGLTSTTDFLSKVESFIHVEVLKLYPDATLPTVDFSELPDGEFEVRYQSARPFADLAAGLIEATIEHFGEPFTVQRHVEGDDGTAARFILKRGG